MEYVPPFDAATPLEAYVDRNLGTGTPGSKVPAAFFNVINAELLALITGAGLVPDDGDLTQVFQAVQALAGANDLLIPRGTTMASAATTNIGAGDSDFFEISGTTTITSLGTGTDYQHVWVKFQGILTLTHHATNLILPTNANIITAAGDVAEFVRIAGGSWQCLEYTRANGQPLVVPLGMKGTTIASAGTTNIGAADSSYIDVSGTTTITSLGSGTTRDHVWVTFQGALTLTYHATDLWLPTLANIVTAANDSAEFIRTGASSWRCVKYLRANGQNLFYPTAYGTTTGGTTAYLLTTTVAPGPLFAGQVINATFNVASTGAATLNVNGTGAISLKDAFGNALAAAQIEANKTYALVYDGANWRVTSLVGQNMPAGTVIDRAYQEFGTYSSAVSIIPQDDTIPQNTEGTEIFNLSITMKSATNRLRVSGVVIISATNTQDAAIALFKNTDVNAISLHWSGMSGAAASLFSVPFVHEFVPGAAGSVTIKGRIGTNAGTMRVNGISTRLGGGVMVAKMVLEEIQQ